MMALLGRIHFELLSSNVLIYYLSTLVIGSGTLFFSLTHEYEFFSLYFFVFFSLSLSLSLSHFPP